MTSRLSSQKGEIRLSKRNPTVRRPRGADGWPKAVRVASHRQLQTRALAGYNPGGKTYGFTSVEEANPADATKPRHRLVIEPTEAAIVRRVFEAFAAGNSPRTIAVTLNGEKVPAAHDGGKGHKDVAGWVHTSIRSMLRNRRYVGEVVWNAFKWKKTAKGTRRRVPRPESEHVVQQRPELVIIAPDVWERVQQRLGARRKPSGPVRPRVGSTFALSGLLRCGACGGNFTVVSQAKKAGVTYRNLGCVAHKDHRCDNAKTVSERKVLAAVVTTLRERLSRPDRVQVFVETFRKRWAELEAEGSPTRELEAKVERQREAVATAVTMLRTVPGSKALGAALAGEETALADLEAQLGAARATRPSILPHPAAIAAYVRNLAELLEGGDVAKAGAALRAAFQPFRMIPDVDGYRLIGAIDVGVCDEKSSGGRDLNTRPSGYEPDDFGRFILSASSRLTS